MRRRNVPCLVHRSARPRSSSWRVRPTTQTPVTRHQPATATQPREPLTGELSKRQPGPPTPDSSPTHSSESTYLDSSATALPTIASRLSTVQFIQPSSPSSVLQSCVTAPNAHLQSATSLRQRAGGPFGVSLEFAIAVLFAGGAVTPTPVDQTGGGVTEVTMVTRVVTIVTACRAAIRRRCRRDGNTAEATASQPAEEHSCSI